MYLEDHRCNMETHYQELGTTKVSHSASGSSQTFPDTALQARHSSDFLSVMPTPPFPIILSPDLDCRRRRQVQP